MEDGVFKTEKAVAEKRKKIDSGLKLGTTETAQ